jgi:hypothetical protein
MWSGMGGRPEQAMLYCTAEKPAAAEQA